MVTYSIVYMDSLNQVFGRPGIYEVLLGTAGVSDNISPVGLRHFQDYRLRLYGGSVTSRNITVHPYCSILITQDPVLFYEGLNGKLKPTSFMYGLPVLNVSCVIIAKCDIQVLGNPSEYSLRPLEFKGECKERPFSRGDSLFVDLLVHLTRLDILPQERDKLLEIIRYEIGVIKRTSPYLEKYLEEILDVVRSKGYKLD